MNRSGKKDNQKKIIKKDEIKRAVGLLAKNQKIV